MVSHGCGEGAGARISRDAFTAIMTEKYLARDPEDEWRKAFAIFDEAGEGRISLKNLRRVAKELGEPIEDDELAAMIGESGGLQASRQVDIPSFDKLNPFPLRPPHLSTILQKNLTPPMRASSRQNNFWK
jgi:hypothetical protein